MEEFVVLVDENNNEIGIEEKMKAHEKGLLHRAFSIFVFNSKGEMLLQQRAFQKYHSGGLWTNTCCSHPRQGEDIEKAAHRRLVEEMGFDCHLIYKFNFIYKAEFDHGLIEHELDNVFIGKFDGTPIINPHEVENYQWIDIEVLVNELSEKPEKYTAWFQIACPKVISDLNQIK